MKKILTLLLAIIGLFTLISTYVIITGHPSKGVTLDNKITLQERRPTITLHRMEFGLTIKFWEDNRAIVFPKQESDIKLARWADDDEFNQLPVENNPYDESGLLKIYPETQEPQFLIFESEVYEAVETAKYYSTDETNPTISEMQLIYILVEEMVKDSKR